jgi:hypothetical protein
MARRLALFRKCIVEVDLLEAGAIGAVSEVACGENMLGRVFYGNEIVDGWVIRDGVVAVIMIFNAVVDASLFASQPRDEYIHFCNHKHCEDLFLVHREVIVCFGVRLRTRG